MSAAARALVILTLVGVGALLAAKQCQAVERDVRDFGAKCDGKTDDAIALQKAMDWAKTARGTLRVPAESTCNYSKVLNLTSAKLVGYGPTSVLYATAWNNSAIYVRGTRPAVRNLRMTGAPAPSRQSGTWFNKISMRDGARNFVIEGVQFDGSSACAIFSTESSGPGRIRYNLVRDTLADAIHHTNGTHDVLVEHNVIERAGDDGVAVVTYGDNAMVKRITARFNTIRDQHWGRGMSVIGGEDVLYEFNTIENVGGGGACMIVAQESGYNTFAGRNVVYRANTMRNCPVDGSKGHSGILVTSSGQHANENIVLARNLIVMDGPTQDNYGIRVDNPANNKNVQVVGNLIVGPKQYKMAEGQPAPVPYVTQLPVGDPGGR